MDELRIALFTGNYNHIKDGVSLTLNRLVKFLEENGVTVKVFGPTVKQPALDHEGELISVPSIPIPGRPEYRLTTGFPKRLQKKMEAFDPALVHIATPDLLGYRALRYARSKNIPVVSSYHTHFTSYLKYYKLQMLESAGWKYLDWFYGQCRHIYVPSASMAEELEEHGIRGEIKIWARGVDTSLFHPDKRDPQWRKQHGFLKDDKVVAFVSRLVWEKDLKTYARTLMELKRSNANIQSLVVGDGPAREELQEMLPEAIFTGFLSGNELARAYACSDIFLFPSDTETFGNVTLEAMSSGLPCVVADATGSKSLVEEGVNGFLAPPRDVQAFARCVQRVASNEELAQQMSRESRQKATVYSWENVNSQLLEYYREILNNSIPS